MYLNLKFLCDLCFYSYSYLPRSYTSAVRVRLTIYISLSLKHTPDRFLFLLVYFTILYPTVYMGYLSF